MAFNYNTGKFFDTFGQYPSVQPASGASRPTVAPSIVPANASYHYPGRAPIAQMTPYGGQTQGFSMPGRDAYTTGPPLMFNYPKRIDLPPKSEPHDIPINLALIRALHPHDKSQVDSDYMGFLIVMERIWHHFMRDILETFCQSLGPTAVRQEFVELQVRQLMALWTRKEAVVKHFPYEIKEVRDVAHVEYERRVRCWHVERHMEEYVASAVLRLRKLGYLIGG
ncbi:MAG: hypothetical protein Q9209_001935 [Squamulea sp. 1 TL-2023]